MTAAAYSHCQKFLPLGEAYNPPCPPLKKEGGTPKKLLLKSPFEKGGFRGIQEPPNGRNFMANADRGDTVKLSLIRDT